MDRVKLISFVWKELQNKKLVHDAIGSGSYNSFGRDLSDKSDAEIRHALDRCKDFTGFFTTPAFRELCSPDPQTLGLPDTDSAYVQACQAYYPVQSRSFSHPAVYHAGADTGWFDLRNNTSDSKKRFRAAYEKRVKQVMDGDQLEYPRHEALPSKVDKKIEGSELKSRLAKMRADLSI